MCGEGDPSDVLNGLTSLLEKGLIQRSTVDGDVRFNLLEAIREYAAEQLAGGDEDFVARRRHAVYFAGVAQAGDAALQDGRQAAWLSRLDHDLENIRAALRFAWTTRDSDLGLSIAGMMWRFWEIRSLLDEGRAWLRDMLALDGARRPARPRFGWRPSPAPGSSRSGRGTMRRRRR